MPDPDVPASLAWPPPFPPSLVDELRSLLEVRPALVIVGPVGGSRNRLAAAVADLPEGPASSRHVARYGEEDHPYFALRQLFRDVPAAPGDTVSDVAEAIRSQLRDTDEPPHIVLANTDLCDAPSIDVLVRLAATGAIRLVATLTPETAAAQTSLQDVGSRVEIPALDGATIAERLRERFGADPHPLLTDLMLQRSGGSYAVVQDLADASFESGAIIVIEGVLVLDPDGGETTADRLRSLLPPYEADRLGGGRAITDLVHLISLLGQLDVQEARGCLGPDVVELALTHGAATIAEGGLVLTSHAESTLVLRTMTLQRQIELFEQFATELPRTIQRHGVAVMAADWWRAAGRSIPAELAARATREANLLGHYRRALIYSDPANNDQHRDVAVIERGFALNELGDHTTLLDMFRSVEPSQLSENELLPYLRGVSLLNDRELRDRLNARAVAADDPEERRRRDAVRRLAELAKLAFMTGDERIANRLRSLTFSSPLSSVNRAMAFGTLAGVLRHSGRPSQAVEAAEFALGNLVAEYDTVSAYHLDMTREFHISALVSAVDIAGAERALQAYSSGVFASAGSGRITTALQAHVAMESGDMSQALASARLCLNGLGTPDPHQIRGWVEAMTAEILVHVGRDDEAHEMLELARQHPSRRPQNDLARRISIASSHDTLAEPEEALEILGDVIDEARRRGLRLALIEAAATSVLIGGPPHLDVLLDAVEDLIEPSGRPLVWQTFALAARDYDIDSLVDLVDQLTPLGARLLAADIAQFVLDMARRATDLDPVTRERLGVLANLSTPTPAG